MGHRLVEIRQIQGDFSICSDCGRWGTRTAKALKKSCVDAPVTMRTKQSWCRVFQRGWHPNYLLKGMTHHPNTRKNAVTMVPFLKLRDAFLRNKRNRRLTKKVRPWVAAALGVNGPVKIPANAMAPDPARSKA